MFGEGESLELYLFRLHERTPNMTELYKGYVKTKDKAPLSKFKGGKNLLTLEEVKDCPEYAGVLADDVILIDVDDGKQAEILMNIVEDLQLDCEVRQTSRGKHFVFKNTFVKKCGTGSKLACGIVADIKVGSRNSTQMLKFNGEDRFVEWECENVQELPVWLRPISTKVDLFELGDGEGRNSKLYTYILRLTSAGFTKEETRQTLNIINKYIFKTPLSEEEIATITREEAFPKSTFFRDKTFLHNEFAQFIKNECNVRRINGQLHVYKDGCYVGGYTEIESAMIKRLPVLKATHRTETLKYLEIICAENEEVASANFIAFKNGVLDITTGELKDFSPDIIVTNPIPWDYEADAYSELADKTLAKISCGDKDIRALLEECMGYCFFRRNELSKAFILTGEKSNGKSTFLDVIKNVLGTANVSALDLSELDERFSIATMTGKLANIGDDISDEFLAGKSISTFKKIVSGNEVKAEFKGQDAFFFNPYVKLLFSANDIPRMKDKTGAVLRRLVIVPFNAKFSKEDPDFDPYITWKLRSEDVMQYMIRLGVEGLRRILENNEFTQSQKVEKEVKEYEIQNNPILLFLNEKEESEIVNQSTKEVHKAYKMFCVENGFTEMTIGNFSKELNRRCGLVVQRRRINGKLTGIYVKE